VIIGKREQSRSVDGISQRVVKSLGWVGDKLGQDAEVIPRAAVKAAELAKEGKAPKKFWVLEQSDIVRLGMTEWS